MSDRAALLQSIAKHPEEDMPRLLYADWLQENEAATDLNCATVEFIRLSCDNRVGGRRVMTKKCYQWICDHWMRLVPSVLKLHRPYQVEDTVRIPGHTEVVIGPDYPVAVPVHYVKGRRVWMRIRLPAPHRRGNAKHYDCSVTMEFFRGFVDFLQIFSTFTWEQIQAPLYVDQPLMRVLDQQAAHLVMSGVHGTTPLEGAPPAPAISLTDATSGFIAESGGQ